MSEMVKSTKIPASSQLDEWFANLIHSIEVDKLKLETNTADSNTKAFYENAMAGNHLAVFKDVRHQVTQQLIKTIIIKFLNEITERKAFPNKLSFSHAPATIRVWAEIDNDDEALEDNLLLAEAKINSFASEFDMCIDTMIVEKDDNLKVPSHYFEITKR